MGDAQVVEDIIAEPDEQQVSFLERTVEVIASNGWYLLGAGIAAYYVWKNYGIPIFFNAQAQGGKPAMTPKEVQDFQKKEEQRLKALEKLQQKYEQEASIKAAQIEAREEEKRRAKFAEMERLNPGITTGTRLGNGTEETGTPTQPKAKSKSPSLRPEYNPLMGDTSSSRNVCFRPASGRSGG